MVSETESGIYVALTGDRIAILRATVEKMQEKCPETNESTDVAAVKIELAKLNEKYTLSVDNAADWENLGRVSFPCTQNKVTECATDICAASHAQVARGKGKASKA